MIILQGANEQLKIATPIAHRRIDDILRAEPARWTALVVKHKSIAAGDIVGFIL